MTDINKKAQIEYPCIWPYKVIGSDRKLVPQMIGVYLEGRAYHLSESNQSKTGKYTSFLVSIEVKDEQDRNHIFATLNKIPTVKMVL